MIRLAFIPFLLLPAAAQAQLFVSVDDQEPLEVVEPVLVDETAQAVASPEPTGPAPTEAELAEAEANDSTLTFAEGTDPSIGADTSIMMDARTIDDVNLLFSEQIAADPSVDLSLVSVETTTLEDGTQVSNLSLGGGQGDGAQAATVLDENGEEVSLTSLEAGECNEDGEWVTENILCQTR